MHIGAVGAFGKGELGGAEIRCDGHEGLKKVVTFRV